MAPIRVGERHGRRVGSRTPEPVFRAGPVLFLLIDAAADAQTYGAVQRRCINQGARRFEICQLCLDEGEVRILDLRNEFLSRPAEAAQRFEYAGRWGRGGAPAFQEYIRQLKD